MTIRDLDKYVARLWDWGFLDQCFGATGIRVSDLDGIVERNGRFLVIEAKGTGQAVPVGQARLFRAFVNTGLFTVLVLWGETNKPARMSAFPGPATACTTADILDFVTVWFQYADEARP